MLKNYNPDVLSCLANLSNDEVFTPPTLANAILDMLPQELFESTETTFLDPCCKSGVFLREIAKRLIKGLEKQIPDLQKRLNHIYTKQLFGIAITELTALLSRRSTYCSKHANGKYSICSAFKNEEGNIQYERVEHTWEGGRCIYCGASKSEYNRDKTLETHAYQFIHNPKELKKMKFDVIVGNPPYQLQVNEGGKGLGAIPIYHKFVEQAKKLNPDYLVMITPSRWFSGGVGLNDFRSEMLNDRRIKSITDYSNSNECFPNVDINGGVSYFLWDKNYNGECEFTHHNNQKVSIAKRKLNEFDIFIRHNDSLSIVHKVLAKTEKFLSDIVSSQTPFGLNSDVRGTEQPFNGSVKLYSSKGIGYVRLNNAIRNQEWIPLYKVMMAKVTTEHGGMPDKEGKLKVLTPLKVLFPNEICTQSYLIVGPFVNEEQSINAKKYIETKFVRFLLQLSLTSMNISKDKFRFVPLQDFNETWTDEKLYKKYGLTQEEIDFIEAMIRPME